MVPGKTWVTVPSVMICSSFAIVRRIYPGGASLSRRAPFSTELVQRERWQIFAKLLAFPPRPSLAKLVHCCEAVSIKHPPDVARRFIGEWVACERAAHI